MFYCVTIHEPNGDDTLIGWTPNPNIATLYSNNHYKDNEVVKFDVQRYVELWIAVSSNHFKCLYPFIDLELETKSSYDGKLMAIYPKCSKSQLNALTTRSMVANSAVKCISLLKYCNMPEDISSFLRTIFMIGSGFINLNVDPVYGAILSKSRDRYMSFDFCNIVII